MSTVPPDFSAQFINGVHEVASHHLGKSVFDAIRNCFTSGKVREGDYFFRRSHTLIREYYDSLPIQDQDAILMEFRKTRIAKQQVESARSSIRRLAKDYRQVAQHLFLVVESASRRADEESLMDQFSRVNAQRAAQLPQFGTISTHSDPFSDSHETSSLADVDVGNLDQVEMSVFESETAGEATVVLGLHGRDGSTQEVAATIPFAVGSDDSGRTGERVETGTLHSFDSHGYFGHSEAGDDVGQ
ncbi:hypothetical protein V8E53_003106 [Lactarius tabidus]